MIKKLHHKYINSKLGRKKTSTQIVYIIAILLAAWFGYGIFSRKSVEYAKPVPQVIKVGVERLEAKSIISDILIYGHTEAAEKIALRLRTGGIVDTIPKHRGSPAKKGDIILTLKMEDRPARLRAAEAAKNKAEIEYNTAVKLIEDDLISRVELVTMETLYKTARASLDQARLDMEHAVFRAPFDGVVDTLNLEIGQYVALGGEVGAFINLNPIKIKAEIPEKYVNRLKKGSVAKVSLSSGQEIDAVLSYVGSVANTATRTFPIELEAPNSKNGIVEGLTAEIRLPLDMVSAVKLTVSSCLTFGDDGSVGVKTINADNIVKFYPVTLVKEEDSGLWVTGLPRQADVIVSGQEFVRIGERVEPRFIDEAGESRGE
jgi:multidrug efflux system membrane fusion protein